MERFGHLLLAVWREACRHIEINESTTTVAELLARSLPLDCMIVRRIDVPTSSWETVAFGRVRNSQTARPARDLLPTTKLKRILSWASESRVPLNPDERRFLDNSRERVERAGLLREHHEVVLAAIAAGRAEILNLHRAGMIHDEVLRTLESDLDLQELAARAALS